MKRFEVRITWSVALTLTCFALLNVAVAHDQIPGAPQRQPIVITGGTIHVVDGPEIENGIVVFDNGKITAVGKNIDVPRTAKKIDASGKHVYPGLIESMSDIGLREINAVEATIDHTERGDRNPNARSWVAVNPDSELIPVARSGGVLLAMTAPRGPWLRGQTAVVQLDGWTVQDMVLKAPVGLYIDWSAMNPRDDDPKKRAEKREDKMLEFDALLDEARRYRAACQSRPEQTPSDLRLDSLLPVLDRELPIIAAANDQAMIESAITYAQAQNLSLIIYGGYDAPRCSGLLKKYQVPVIISGIYRLPRRRHDPYDASYTLPDRLRRAGVRYAISGSGAGSPGGAALACNLPYHVATAVAYGLPREEAIRSITLSAAKILGVADRVGSITVGKDATLIISDGDILETESNVTAAFIQGRRVDLGSRHKSLHQKYQQKYTIKR